MKSKSGSSKGGSVYSASKRVGAAPSDMVVSTRSGSTYLMGKRLKDRRAVKISRKLKCMGKSSEDEAMGLCEENELYDDRLCAYSGVMSTNKQDRSTKRHVILF
jgi:hypothetical protein